MSTEQLHAAGLQRGAIDLRVRAGRRHRVHRGVYAVGHLHLTLRGRLWAAVLACGGPGAAVLSHRSAAALWDLLPPPARIEVTTRRRSASTASLRVHRSTTLAGDDVTAVDGLPVTSVTRTLVDLADVLALHRLERACHRADVLRRLDATELAQRLTALPGRRTRGLRLALAGLALHGPELTRSELEERFLVLVARERLPRPEVNVTVVGLEVDALWRAQRLVVELDGAAAHLITRAFERDRRRDAALQVAGLRVVRFTWRQVVHEPSDVTATLRALLEAG